MPNRILILFAHPALERSRANKDLILAAEGMDGVLVNDLYESYPDLMIDVKREQKLLLDHDVIIFQHPFFWYSTPAILKEWQDVVLEHGFAYGSNITTLRGKLTFHVITTGGGHDGYRPGGYNRFTVRQFLAPYEQTAVLCGMKFLSPFVLHGAHSINESAQVAPFANSYRRILEALRAGTIDLDYAASCERLNDNLARLIKAN